MEKSKKKNQKKVDIVLEPVIEQIQINTQNRQFLWAENNNGEFIPARNYDSSISADSSADSKELNDIDWKKTGFTKDGLTLLNGAQSAEVKDKSLKPGDYAYHRPKKQYVKLDKLIVKAAEDKTADKSPSLNSWDCTV